MFNKQHRFYLNLIQKIIQQARNYKFPQKSSLLHIQVHLRFQEKMERLKVNTYTIRPAGVFTIKI